MTTPNKIRVARYERLLSKLIDSEEQYSPAREIATEIFPSLVLENDRFEYKLMGGTRPVGGRIFASNAATAIFCGIYNPPTSNHIAVLEWCRGMFDNTAAGAANFRFGLGQYSNLTSDTGIPYVTDTRDKPSSVSPNSPIQIAYYLGVNVLGILDEVFVNAGSIGDREFDGACPVLVAPGYAAGVQVDVAPISLRAAFRWYERAMTPQEVVPG